MLGVWIHVRGKQTARFIATHSRQPERYLGVTSKCQESLDTLKAVLEAPEPTAVWINCMHSPFSSDNLYGLASILAERTDVPEGDMACGGIDSRWGDRTPRKYHHPNWFAGGVRESHVESARD